jgi:hypothetical protein
MHSMKSFMVLFVTAFLETHVLVIMPFTLYHRKHSKAIAYHIRFLQFRKDKITVTSRQKMYGVSLRFPTL